MKNITDIMSGEDGSFKADLIRGGLRCLVPPYLMATKVRNACFNLGLRKQRSLGRFTISVGNVSAGGTGKTPVVADLYERLCRRGLTPAILMRGYRAEQTDGHTSEDDKARGDEARVYEQTLGSQVILGVHPKRVIGAKEVLKRHESVNVFLLDDGFQHRQAARDINIVLIDSETWLNDKVLPRGFLRESKSSVRRADLIVLTHAGDLSSQECTMIQIELQKWTKAPVIACSHAWSHLLDERDEKHAPEHLWIIPEPQIVAICGIGKPDGFIKMVRKHTDKHVSSMVYRDHAAYEASHVAQFLDKCYGRALIMTEKDWVKWREVYKLDLTDAQQSVKVYRPQLRLKWLDKSEQKLDSLLDEWAGFVNG